MWNASLNSPGCRCGISRSAPTGTRRSPFPAEAPQGRRRVRVLVVGGGGREHALCWRLSQNPMVDRLFAAPGNAGIGEVGTLGPIRTSDVQGIADLAERESIDLTVV